MQLLTNAGWLEFILLGLAIYRVARMMATEHGPFEAFYLWRGWLATKLKHDPKTGRQNWIEQGFNCPACLSFWGGIVSAWVLSPVSFVAYCVVALALSAFATALFRITG